MVKKLLNLFWGPAWAEPDEACSTVLKLPQSPADLTLRPASVTCGLARHDMSWSRSTVYASCGDRTRTRRKLAGSSLAR